MRPAGLPARLYNLAFADGSTIGVNDGVILVSLKDGHAPTADYVRKLRQALPAAFPEDIFYFAASNALVVAGNVTLIVAVLARTAATRTLGTKSRCSSAAAATWRCRA